jgi:hypothetical protein
MDIICGTASPETVEHYSRPEVMDTILRISKTSNFLKWAVGDSRAWYRTGTRGRKFPQPMDSRTYRELTRRHRTLYTTLSYFAQETYEIELSLIEKQEVTRLSKEKVRGYTFGIDVDSIDKVNGHGANITDPKVKEAVEAMAKFFIEKLREYRRIPYMPFFPVVEFMFSCIMEYLRIILPELQAPKAQDMWRWWSI